MNYLAHAWLSFGRPSVLVGNMISDFVKGRKQFDYPTEVQQGIRLHRAIDRFTDTHPATRAAAAFFKPVVGLYAGAFVDIVYDHFLALDTQEATERGWKTFAAETYHQLNASRTLLPDRFAMLLPYMQEQDWLFNYRFTQAIRNSFGGLVRRARYLDNADPPFGVFMENYEALGSLYRAFFPAVKMMAFTQLTENPI